ncbi:hypothetical protein D9M68_339580 [compost metagenome]
MRIGADLGGQQRAFEIPDEGGPVGHLEVADLRQPEDLFGRLAFVLHRGDAARRHRRLDAGCRHAHVLRLDHRPLAGALLAGLVEDQIDDRFAGQRISGLQHLLGDLDQVGVEAALVPGAEDVADLGRRHLQAVAQDAVDFGDHLHVGIFDAVVDGLDEMAGAVFAEPGNARVVVVFRGNRGQNALDALPGFFLAADHDRRAVARAFLTAGNAHADEGTVLQRLEAAHRVAEVGVAGIDHDVALGKVGLQDFHLLIDRLTGLDHDDDRPRRADGGDERFDGVAGHDLALKVAGFRVEFMRRLDGAVEHGDLVALFSDVERQVRAHDAKTD